MRWIADIPNPQNDFKRLMLYDSADGVYLFAYQSMYDCDSDGDEWYENVAQAKTTAEEKYNVTQANWEQIGDPLPYCQHDWIAPVRVKGRHEGKPEWGQMEMFVDGAWKPLK